MTSAGVPTQGSLRALPCRMRTATRASLWWKLPVVVLLSIIGAFAALVCLVNYLLLGLAGASAGGWEPILWPLGMVAAISVPVLTGWWLLSPRLRAWVPIVMVVGVTVGMFGVLMVLSGV